MSILEIILIGLSLAMDAFSISIIMGLKNNRIKTGLIIACSFAFFQFIMPIIGFYLGNLLSEKIINYHTYLSVALLVLIGILMLTEKKSDNKYKLNSKELIILSIATSIDAFVIGISFSFLQINLLLATLIIGIITFIMCYIGYSLGHLFNKKAHQYANLIGGITLILIGLKILLETLL